MDGDGDNKKSLEEEAAEQAALPYVWRQTLGDVDVTFQVPQGTRGRDLKISIGSQKLSVILGKEELAVGTLSAPIRADDSTWTLEGRELVIHLEKSGTPAWWAHVLTHHPKIDTTRIVPENSKLGDLDGETRAMVFDSPRHIHAVNM